MQIDDAVHTAMGVLQADPVLDGAEIVAQMQRAGRLDAGENDIAIVGHAIMIVRRSSGFAAGCIISPLFQSPVSQR